MEVSSALGLWAGHFPIWVLIPSTDNETLIAPEPLLARHKRAKLEAVFSGFFLARSGHERAKVILQFYIISLKMKLLDLDSPPLPLVGK